MALLGFIVSIIAAGFLLIGLIPFLGWINWFTTLPIAVIGAALSGISLTRRNRFTVLGILGIIIAVLVFFAGVNRLIIGCGIF